MVTERKSYESNETCEKCGKSRSHGSGSLTQWIVACQCLESLMTEPPIGPVTKLCSTCGKAVSEGRHGSMTQWIFRIDTCRCANPTVIFGKATESESGVRHNSEINPVIANGVILNDEPALEVDPDKFPTERYKAVELLGQGMNGIVFRAHDTLLARTVAIKSVRVTSQLTSEQALQFQREARATSHLEHRNLIQLYDFGITSGGVPYLVMEFFKGFTLASLIEREKSLPLVLAIQLMIEICRGVEHAHQRGVMHRDLKSNNILLLPPETDAYWSCKIIDFGLAALPAVSLESADVGLEGSMIGSPAYMSPEQIRGSDIDNRTDIYSLGCIFFEMLTGAVPFVSDTALATMMMHVSEAPPLLSSRKPGLLCQEMLDSIVSKMLQKKSEDRYESITDLKEELKQLLILVDSQVRAEHLDDGDVHVAQQPSAEVLPDSKRSKHRVVFLNLIGCISLIVLMVLGFNSVRSKLSPKVEPSVTATMHTDKDLFGLPPMPEEESRKKLDKSPSRTGIRTGQRERDNLYLPVNRNLYVNQRTVTGGADADDESLKVFLDGDMYSQVDTLNMRGTSLHGSGLRYLTGRKIKNLDLSENELSPEAIPLLSKLPDLTSISLNHCIFSEKSDFSSLKNCQKLEELSVSDSKVNDLIVRGICNIETLITLTLASNPGVSDVSVVDLCRLRKLRTLDITESSISGAGLIRLLALPKLVVLSANCAPLTDAELVQLIDSIKNKPMEALAINCSLVGDETALKLLNLRSSLNTLDLRGGRRLRGGTRAKLKSVWPTCFDFDETLPESLEGN